jgi:hypothetical protein
MGNQGFPVKAAARQAEAGRSRRRDPTAGGLAFSGAVTRGGS